MSPPEMRSLQRPAEADGVVNRLPSEGWTGFGYRIRVVRGVRRKGLGEEFLATVDASFDAIQARPEMFSRVHGSVRRAIVFGFPYAVFYRVEPLRVVVLTVLHTARDPKLWPGLKDHAR